MFDEGSMCTDQWVNSYFGSFGGFFLCVFYFAKILFLQCCSLVWGVEMSSQIVREGALGRLAIMVSIAQPRGRGGP